MKVRPILIETKDKDGLLFKNSLIGKLSYGELSPVKCSHFQLILISLDPDDKIEVGDKYLDDCGLIRVSITNDKDYWNKRLDYKKVIATQNQISPKDTLQFVIDYNNNNDIKDLEIEMEEFSVMEKMLENENYVPMGTFKIKPKLTNGFVTIIKENK